MKETEFYGRLNEMNQKFNALLQGVQQFMQSVRLDSTGKEIRLLGLQQLLIKKGIFTEAEMSEQTGSVLMEMQKQAEEEAKKQAEQEATKINAPTIVPATPEQVVQVATETVVPPQA